MKIETGPTSWKTLLQASVLDSICWSYKLTLLLVERLLDSSHNAFLVANEAATVAAMIATKKKRR